MDTLRVLAEGGSWEDLELSLSDDDGTTKNNAPAADEQLPAATPNHCQEDLKNETSKATPPMSPPASDIAVGAPSPIATLRPLAIAMSIHQPSPLLLNSFDKVMILSEGCVVYYGSPRGINDFTRAMEIQSLAACARLAVVWQHDFEVQVNSHCPRDVCPLDFIIERLASKKPWVKKSSFTTIDNNEGGSMMASSCEDLEGDTIMEARQGMSYETAVWFMYLPRYALIYIYNDISARKEYDEYCACVQPAKSVPHADTFKIIPFNAQFQVLLRRALVLMSRSSWTTTSSLVETLLVAFIAGLCWWNTRLSENSVTDITGFLSFGTTYWFFSSLYVGLMEFFPERQVVQKERDSGSYQLSAYFLSKFIANLPIRIILPVIYVLIAYPMIFHSDPLTSSSVLTFVMILGIVVLASQSGESIGLVIGIVSSSMEVAMSTATTVSLSMLIFGGFYKQNFPFFLAWLGAFSALRYSYDASVQVAVTAQKDIQCDGGLYIPLCYAQDTVSSAYVLDWLQVNSNSVTMNVVYLVLMATGLRMLAYLCLRFISYRPARGYV